VTSQDTNRNGKNEPSATDDHKQGGKDGTEE
jgi:hypothetical protein